MMHGMQQITYELFQLKCISLYCLELDLIIVIENGFVLIIYKFKYAYMFSVCKILKNNRKCS